MDRALTSLFKDLAARPAPEHVMRVVDLLEEAEAEGPGHAEEQLDQSK